MAPLLFVTTVAPGGGAGGNLVTLTRLQALRRLGFVVTLVRHGPAFDAAPLGDACAAVEAAPGRGGLGHLWGSLRRLAAEGSVPYWSHAAWRAVEAWAARHPAGLVFLDSLHAAEYGRRLLEAGFGGAVVLHEHNVEHRLLARQRDEAPFSQRAGLAWRERRFRLVEARLSRFAHLCLTLSDDDARVLQAANPGFTVRCVPAAVDVAHYAPRRPLGEAGRLLFIGGCRWPANLDGVTWLAKEVWPLVRARLPEARLDVVGRDAPAFLRGLPGVEVHGYVEDERAAFDAARAVLVPIRFGSGVRVKILTALAMGRAVVSTTLGAEGIAAAEGVELLRADGAQAFADAAVRALADEGLARRLGEAGRAFAVRTHGPAAVDRQLALAFRGLGIAAGPC